MGGSPHTRSLKACVLFIDDDDRCDRIFMILELMRSHIASHKHMYSYAHRHRIAWRLCSSDIPHTKRHLRSVCVCVSVMRSYVDLGCDSVLDVAAMVWTLWEMFRGSSEKKAATAMTTRFLMAFVLVNRNGSA